MELECLVPSIQYVVDRHCAPSWHLKEAILQFHNFMFVLEGEAYICYDAEEKYHTVTGGHLVYCPKGVARKAYMNAEKPMHCYAVNFEYILCQKDAEAWRFELETPELPIDRILPIRNMEALTALFKEMNREWMGKKSGYILKCRIALMEILYRVFRENRLYKTDDAKLKRVEKVMNHIAEHHRENMGLRQMAELAGLSPVYFGSIFKDISGFSPKEYQNYVRVHKARDILLGGGYTVGEAAEMVGFSDIYYFSRVFKRITGKNPSEYK